MNTMFLLLTLDLGYCDNQSDGEKHLQKVTPFFKYIYIHIAIEYGNFHIPTAMTRKCYKFNS